MIVHRLLSRVTNVKCVFHNSLLLYNCFIFLYRPLYYCHLKSLHANHSNCSIILFRTFIDVFILLHTYEKNTSGFNVLLNNSQDSDKKAMVVQLSDVWEEDVLSLFCFPSYTAICMCFHIPLPLWTLASHSLLRKSIDAWTSFFVVILSLKVTSCSSDLCCDVNWNILSRSSSQILPRDAFGDRF